MQLEISMARYTILILQITQTHGHGAGRICRALCRTSFLIHFFYLIINRAVPAFPSRLRGLDGPCLSPPPTPPGPPYIHFGDVEGRFRTCLPFAFVSMSALNREILSCRSGGNHSGIFIVVIWFASHLARLDSCCIMHYHSRFIARVWSISKLENGNQPSLF